METEGIGPGSLTLGLDYENGFERVWSRPVALSGAGDLAVVCVEPLSAVRSFALSFDGMEANASFRVLSVRAYTGGSVPVSGNDWLGHVTRLERDGDSVFFGGSMTRDAARSPASR